MGFGVTGQAVAAELAESPTDVVVVDDAPTQAMRDRARRLGVYFQGAPPEAELARLVGSSTRVVVSPGIPASHPVFRVQPDAEVVSEVELGWEISQAPIVAITGTNGKTTITTLVKRMLVASGRRAVACGNIGRALVEAAAQREADVLVAEVSSFQLALTRHFRPAVALWCNVAPDHLDWHPSFDDYVAAKARIWANQCPGDVAIANGDDPEVVKHLPEPGPSTLTFGRGGDWRVEGGMIAGPDGTVVAVEALPRRLPHDVENALAACAAACAAGARLGACGQVLEAFDGLAHRVETVATLQGVRWVDDSKATTPSAALAAIRSFDPVVLVAGGRNKGLDLSVLAEAAPRLRAVVAIGEAAREVEAVFTGRVARVERAPTMRSAVSAAAAAAHAGDTVLLAPACASFDWYESYAARGEDFAAEVRALEGAA